MLFGMFNGLKKFNLWKNANLGNCFRSNVHVIIKIEKICMYATVNFIALHICKCEIIGMPTSKKSRILRKSNKIVIKISPPELQKLFSVRIFQKFLLISESRTSCFLSQQMRSSLFNSNLLIYSFFNKLQKLVAMMTKLHVCQLFLPPLSA